MERKHENKNRIQQAPKHNKKKTWDKRKLRNNISTYLYAVAAFTSLHRTVQRCIKNPKRNEQNNSRITWQNWQPKKKYKSCLSSDVFSSSLFHFLALRFFGYVRSSTRLNHNYDVKRQNHKIRHMIRLSKMLTAWEDCNCTYCDWCKTHEERESERERVSEDTYNHICTVPTFAECIRAQTAHQIMAIKNRIRVLYVAYAANAIRNWVERVAEATTTKSQAAANIFEILPWCSFPVPSPCCSLQFHSFFAADTTVECVSSIFSSSPALIGDLANLLSAWVCLCTHPILCALDWIVRAYWTSFDACNRLLSVSSSSTTTSSSMAVVIVLIFQFFSGQEKGNVPIQA